MTAEALHDGAAVEPVSDERVIDRGEVRADLVAQCARDLHPYERELTLLADDFVGRGRGARGVAHDVARVHARIDAPLVLRVIGDRELD